jgi:hypothetical protein
LVPSIFFCCCSAFARAAANAAAGDGRLYDLWIPNIVLLPSIFVALLSFVKLITFDAVVLGAVGGFLADGSAAAAAAEALVEASTIFRFLFGRVCCCCCLCLLLNVNPPAVKVVGVFTLFDDDDEPVIVLLFPDDDDGSIVFGGLPLLLPNPLDVDGRLDADAAAIRAASSLCRSKTSFSLLLLILMNKNLVAFLIQTKRSILC